MIVRRLKKSDCLTIAGAFQQQGWTKQTDQYENYFSEQEAGVREVLIAIAEQEFAGYLTILWNSEYPPFREKSIPEILDFNVLIKFQRRGIGTDLMNAAEKSIADKSDYAGIGVGLFSDYGNAQRLYVKRGYIPDGLGIFQNGYYPEQNNIVLVDDRLALYLTKKLR